MKTFKTLLVTLAVLAAAIYQVKAQALDTTLSRAFNPSVISKVYDVARHVGLSIEQQYALANLYSVHDSLLVERMIGGASDNEMDSMDKASIHLLTDVLSKDQLIMYGQSKGKDFASIAAQGELAYIKATYKPDSTVYHAAKFMTENKYKYIYNEYLFNAADKNKFADLVKLRSKNFDIYSIYTALYNKKFVNDYLEKITKIEAIPDTTIEKIKMAFNVQLYTDKFQDWGGILDRLTQRFLPDTLIFSRLHANDFEKQAYELTEADDYNLIYLQKISRNAYDSVYHLIKAKNYTKALLQYTYSFYHHETFDTLIKQTTKYYDSAIEASLLKDGALQSSSQFAIALKYKNFLNLRTGLTDTLLHHAMYLAQKRDSILQIDPFAVIDFSAYESEKLSDLLTDDQYTQLLYFKNRTQAAADASMDWNEMESRGLTWGFNKEEATTEIKSYYVLKYGAWNRLAYNKIKQWAGIHALEDIKPQALKILDPVRWSGTTLKTTNSMKIQW